MKYAAIKMDLHKGNKEASEGAMMLNIGRGLIEAAQTLQANGGDPKEVLRLQAEANEYLDSAARQLREAAHCAQWVGLALETNAKDPSFVD